MVTDELEDLQHQYYLHAATYRAGAPKSWHEREEALRKKIDDAKREGELVAASIDEGFKPGQI